MTTKEEFERRIEEAKKIANGGSSAFIQIAKEQAEAGMFEEALQTARAMIGIVNDGEEVGHALEWIVSIAGDMGVEATSVCEEALEIAQTMECDGCRRHALGHITIPMAEMDTPIFEKALEIAGEELGGQSDSFIRNRRASAQAKRGLFKEALETARAIRHGGCKTTTLTEIACEQARAGVPEEALQTAKAIEEAANKVRALLKIAEVQIKAGMDATSVFTEAVRTARTTGGLERANAILAIAKGQADAGIDPKPLFDEALETARKWRDSEEIMARIALEIGVEQARAGIDSAPLFREAFENARKMEGFGRWGSQNEKKNQLLIDIARGQIEAKLLEDAIETACEISESRKERQDFLLEIARASAKELRLQKAREGEFQKPDFKKTAGQPPAEKAKEKR